MAMLELLLSRNPDKSSPRIPLVLLPELVHLNSMSFSLVTLHLCIGTFTDLLTFESIKWYQYLVVLLLQHVFAFSLQIMPWAGS